jgi:hypothetical protein
MESKYETLAFGAATNRIETLFCLDRLALHWANRASLRNETEECQNFLKENFDNSTNLQYDSEKNRIVLELDRQKSKAIRITRPQEEIRNELLDILGPSHTEDYGALSFEQEVKRIFSQTPLPTGMARVPSWWNAFIINGGMRVALGKQRRIVKWRALLLNESKWTYNVWIWHLLKTKYSTS